jgi:SAM-dependent methyltransferase
MTDKEPSLNEYGDTLLETTGVHGADIASQRLDDLDLRALRFAIDEELPAPLALDVGCGFGVQGMRFAMLGLETYLYDLFDISERVIAYKDLFPFTKIHFHAEDLRKQMPQRFPAHVGLVYSQRFIHYLRYGEASSLLKLLFDAMVYRGRLFLSASGLNSELGNGYVARDRPLERRFARLEAGMGEKHQIHDDICLYTEADLRQLTAVCGFEEIDIWSSTFGNVKGVFVKL